MPGVHGRINHLDFDESTARVFIAAIGNNSVEIVDVAKGERVRSIRDLPEPQGVNFDPEPKGLAKSIAVSCGGDGSVRLFDSSTYEQTARLDLGVTPTTSDDHA